MIRNLILYSLFFCSLFFSCTGENKAKTETDQPAIDETLKSAGIPSEIVYKDSFSEENTLAFFNPIGIIGTGLVNISSYIEDENHETVSFERIVIYNDSACENLFCDYNIDRANNPPKDKNIIPIYNSIDYGWYCFVCTASNADSYEVAINGTDKKYIRKNRNIKYYTWENFFQSVFTIDPTEDNPLRESPSDDAPVVDDLTSKDEGDEPEDYYQEVRLEDEWLHIKYKKSGHEGWLRWKKGNDVIVDICISW
ncbi:hypothetical protein [Dysgonomonas sp. 25]|uniref:hypothetical protein n=1 Tax=Dysgonomonas sp. 25 TaxID=2302933 RepID=UPI0013D17B3D|nr:hypothetical protein [Dysgonomonas sp. 25]NDV68680.1 hypothetical protein [Dysgonomonas sp. 25]